MPPDLWKLYPLMLKSRLFEEAVAKLWHDGLISGEMHLGTGEEAIIAGASYLVIGRPVTAAADPIEALRSIDAEIDEVR